MKKNKETIELEEQIEKIDAELQRLQKESQRLKELLNMREE